MQKFLAGNLDQRLLLTRKNAAHGEIAELVEQFNRLGDDYRSIYNSLSRRDSLQKDASQTHEGSIIQVAQAAVKANSLDELLQTSLQIIAQDFACLYCAAYLMESQPGKASGSHPDPIGPGNRISPGRHPVRQPKRRRSQAKKWADRRRSIQTTSPSRTGSDEQASSAQRAMVDSYSSSGNEAQPDSGAGLMPGYLEAAIPILWGGQTIGVLDLVSSRSASDSNGQPFSPFASRSLGELQKIADVIALAMAALTPRPPATAGEEGASGYSRSEPAATILPAISQTPAGLLGVLYQASHLITRAETPDEVFKALGRRIR